MAVRTERVALGHATIAIHDWGGTGPTLLLAHPTGFHGQVWAPVARALTDRHRVLSFDFRGHGDSDAPPLDEHDYAWSGFADDALAVAAHVHAQHGGPIVAAGHSKGAASLLLAQAREPGTFSRLWLYEPIVFPSMEAAEPQHDFVLAVGARRRRNTWDSPDDARASYAGKPPLDVLHPDALTAYVEHGLREDDGAWVLKCRPEIEAQVYAMGVANMVWPRLPEVTVPARVLCGEHSDAIDPRFAARIAERLPHGSLEVWEGHGHFGPLVDPARAAASIAAFAAAGS